LDEICEGETEGRARTGRAIDRERGNGTERALRWNVHPVVRVRARVVGRRRGHVGDEDDGSRARRSDLIVGATELRGADRERDQPDET
jgi:hypothetical protein